MRLFLALILTVFEMFAPTPRQIEALQIIKGPETNILLYGGTRSGKTAIIMQSLIYRALKYPGSRHLAARLRFAHARTSLFHETLAPAIRQLPEGVAKANIADSFYAFSNGSEIWVGGFDDSDRIEKILGHEYATVFFNEISQINYATVILGMTRLAQNIPGCRNKAFYDCNPPSPAHWAYKLFMQHIDPRTGNKTARPELYESLAMNPVDNVQHLPENYIRDFLETLPDMQRRRFLLGEWVSLPGTVYRNIKAENIIKIDEKDKHIDRFDDITIGMDFGITSCYNVWGHKDCRSTCIYERTIMHGTTKDIIAELDSVPAIKIFGLVIYADHEDDRIKELQTAGYRVKKAFKAVSAGDSSVNERELFFDDTCGETFNSMLSLQHQDDGHESFIEKHVKENDHHADAARYAIHGYKVDNHGASHVFLKRGIVQGFKNRN